jgi:hypothetical protein
MQDQSYWTDWKKNCIITVNSDFPYVSSVLRNTSAYIAGMCSGVVAARARTTFPMA